MSVTAGSDAIRPYLKAVHVVDGPARSLFSSRTTEIPGSWATGFFPALSNVWVRCLAPLHLPVVCPDGMCCFLCLPIYPAGTKLCSVEELPLCWGGNSLVSQQCVNSGHAKELSSFLFPFPDVTSAKTSVYLIPLQFTCQADQWRDSWTDWSHLCISH